MNRARRDALGGISLIEILVALVVFTTGILGLVGVLPACSRTQAQAREVTLATSVASDKLEAVKAMAFQNVTTGNLPAQAGQVNLSSDGVNTTLNYAASYTVTTVTSTRKAVSVLVSWPSSAGARYVRLDTEVGP